MMQATLPFLRRRVVVPTGRIKTVIGGEEDGEDTAPLRDRTLLRTRLLRQSLGGRN